MNYSMSSENEYSYPSIYTFPYFLICKDMSIIVPYVSRNLTIDRHIKNTLPTSITFIYPFLEIYLQ